jgi:two-component system cell cycle sensor histidine kinase/response regulator CckA
VVFNDLTERKRAEEALRESEEQLRLALQAANQGLYDLNVQTGEAKVSPEYTTMLGYDPGEFQETTTRWIERLHPDDREQAVATYQAYVREDTPDYIVEFRQRTKSGDWKWILSLGQIVAWDEEGKPLRMLGTHTDITQRKQMEESLARTQIGVDRARDAIHWVKADGGLAYVNQAFCDSLGYSHEELLSLSIFDIDPLLSKEGWSEHWQQSRERGPHVFETLHKTKDGRIFPVEIAINFIIFGGQEYHCAFARDITERKQAEEALRNSERRLADIIDFLPDATFAIDLEGKVIAWNRAIEEMTGVPAAEIIGKGGYEYTLPFYGMRRPALINLVFMPDAEIEKKYAFVKKEGDILLAETEVHLKGETQLVWAKARPLYNGEGKIIGAIEAIRDISERQEAERALRESETRFRQVVEHSPMPIAIVKGDQGEYLNPKFVETLGYTLEDLPRLADWFRLAYPDPDYRQSIMKKWQQALEEAIVGDQTIQSLEVQVTCKDGSVRTMEIWGVLVGSKTLFFCSDLTERKRAEEERARLEAQMREVQKLESLGVLAGGIAHDFNNLLMAILGNADLVLHSLSPASPARPNVEEIAQASQRAADLCRQMLAYSGKGRFVVGRYDLSEIVREMAQMLKVSVSKQASLRYSFAADLPAVEADATQIRQIVMNLITNASEAIGGAGGVISISTGVMDCDRSYLSESHLDENLPEGRYVYLEVSDNGNGMDEETRRRIFDPFYTTKFTGRGLGLAAVLGIVRGHQGAIKVYSEPGQGTTFKVLLPAVAWEPGDRAEIAEPEALPHYGGTILLIDDDQDVCRVASEMLTRLGFKVITAAHGREGLEIFKTRAGEIDCVLLDLTMPEMGGEEAFRELRRLRRDVRVILSSGYNEQDVTQRFVGKGLAGFIQKPFTMGKLQVVLSQVFG